MLLSNLFHKYDIASYTTWDTDLPMNIWINLPLSQKASNIILYFQINKSTCYDKRHYGKLNLVKNCVKSKKRVLKKRKCNLDSASLAHLEAFSKNNNFALRSLANQLISSIDFLSVMIKEGKETDSYTINQAKVKTQEIIKSHLDNGYYSTDKYYSSVVQNALKE